MIALTTLEERGDAHFLNSVLLCHYINMWYASLDSKTRLREGILWNQAVRIDDQIFSDFHFKE